MELLQEDELHVVICMISESDTLWAYVANMIHEQKSEEWTVCLINEMIQSLHQNQDMMYDMFGGYVMGVIIKYSLLINLN